MNMYTNNSRRQNLVINNTIFEKIEITATDSESDTPQPVTSSSSKKKRRSKSNGYTPEELTGLGRGPESFKNFIFEDFSVKLSAVTNGKSEIVQFMLENSLVYFIPNLVLVKSMLNFWLSSMNILLAKRSLKNSVEEVTSIIRHTISIKAFLEELDSKWGDLVEKVDFEPSKLEK